MSKQFNNNKPSQSSQDSKLSNQIFCSAFIRELEGLNGVQKGILQALASRLGDNDCVWPSLDRLAKDSGFSKVTVSANMKFLIDVGLIIKRKQAGRYGTNIYIFSGVKELYPLDVEGSRSFTRGVKLPCSGVKLLYPKVYSKDNKEDKNGIASHSSEEKKKKKQWWRE